MNHRQRIRILKLAQANPSAGAPASAPGTVPVASTTTTTDNNTDAPTTTPAPTLNSSQASVNIRALPSFRPQLFQLRPDLIDDFGKLANTINRYLLLLSGNVVSFSTVYTNPAITGDQYTQSVKNLLTLGKWIYNLITSHGPEYTVGVLQQMTQTLLSMVKSYAFSENNATNAQTELVSQVQTIITKLGTANKTSQQQRKHILRRLAQANPSAGAPASAPGTSATSAPTTTTTSTTTPTTTTTPAAVKIDIQAIPGFRPDLFSQRPDLILDMSRIINAVNGYLQMLTQNQVSFAMTWLDPSISGSQYVNSVKNLFNLAKWLFGVLTTKTTKFYSLDGLKQIATTMISMVRQYSFPEPMMSNTASQLIAMGESMLAKLGTTK
jgi:hypothetical protein